MADVGWVELAKPNTMLPISREILLLGFAGSTQPTLNIGAQYGCF
jgi:hypothetical protein